MPLIRFVRDDILGLPPGFGIRLRARRQTSTKAVDRGPEPAGDLFLRYSEEDLFFNFENTPALFSVRFDHRTVQLYRCCQPLEAAFGRDQTLGCNLVWRSAVLVCASSPKSRPGKFIFCFCHFTLDFGVVATPGELSSTPANLASRPSPGNPSTTRSRISLRVANMAAPAGVAGGSARPDAGDILLVIREFSPLLPSCPFRRRSSQVGRSFCASRDINDTRSGESVMLINMSSSCRRF